MVEQEIDRALERLCTHQHTQHLPEAQIRHILEHFAERLRSAVRYETLLSIRSAQEAADAWGVSRRRAQQHIAQLHQRAGVGARIGRVWFVTQEEIERCPPGSPGRPAQGNTHEN